MKIELSNIDILNVITVWQIKHNRCRIIKQELSKT